MTSSQRISGHRTWDPRIAYPNAWPLYHRLLTYHTYIINTSIVTGIFPAAWKHAVVTPLFKKEDPKENNNYRPIFLLLVVYKISENIVANQLLQYIEHNSLFSKNDIKLNLSTETAQVHVS